MIQWMQALHRRLHRHMESSKRCSRRRRHRFAHCAGHRSRTDTERIRPETPPCDCTQAGMHQSFCMHNRHRHRQKSRASVEVAIKEQGEAEEHAGKRVVRKYPSAKRRSGNKEGNTQQGTAITGVRLLLRQSGRVNISPGRCR